MYSLLIKYGLKYLVPILVALMVLWKVYSMGAGSVQDKWDIERAQVEAAYSKEVARLSNISKEVETEYIFKDVIIKEKGDVIVQKVKEYITVTDDSVCDIGPGFVELHNAAVEGRVPNPNTSHEFDEGTTAPQLSDVGRTVVVNYTQYNRMAEQLSSLQEWAKKIGGHQDPR